MIGSLESMSPTTRSQSQRESDSDQNSDHESDGSDAFELLETIPVRESIRVGSPRSRYRKPKCFCMGDNGKPCKHLIYLLDQVNHHTAGHEAGTQLRWAIHLRRLWTFTSAQLATSLKCEIISPDSRYWRPSRKPVLMTTHVIASGLIFSITRNKSPGRTH